MKTEGLKDDCTTYADIMHLPHATSKRHPRMSAMARAAQFAPFAALTGHDAALLEAARLTCQPMELSADERAQLDRKMLLLRAQLASRPAVTVVFFVPDDRKQGGSYHRFTGNVRTIDDASHLLIFADGTRFAMATIIYIDI